MVYNIIMRNNQIDNVFTPEEIQEIKAVIEQELATREVVEWDDAVDGNWHESSIIRIKRNNLGRLDINEVPLPPSIIDKVTKLAKDNCQIDVDIERLIAVTYAEYSLKYGQPKLDVHKDRDPFAKDKESNVGGAGVVRTAACCVAPSRTFRSLSCSWVTAALFTYHRHPVRPVRGCFTFTHDSTGNLGDP